jgi:hypothetical protein
MIYAFLFLLESRDSLLGLRDLLIENPVLLVQSLHIKELLLFLLVVTQVLLLLLTEVTFVRMLRLIG